jgi:NAD(P)-dependent dehydrogenase (short-subunit alcohol dehydrogenase family)
MANYLIIGASSGIGFQLATQLSNAGNQVYGTYNKHPLASDNQFLEYHFLDVLQESGLNLNFLPESIDGIAYCPGSINLRPFDRLKSTDFIADYELQVIGAIKVIQAVLPKLKQSEKASIVLFSTVAVQTGLPFHSIVSASKGALEGLTKALAAEYSPKIRVNCIAPSLTETPLAAALLNTDQKKEANASRHPLNRYGQVEDIANLAEFLLSQKSSWITGQIHKIDGGLSSLKK